MIIDISIVCLTNDTLEYALMSTGNEMYLCQTCIINDCPIAGLIYDRSYSTMTAGTSNKSDVKGLLSNPINSIRNNSKCNVNHFL